MTDSAFMSLGEDYVLDEQERQTQLSNEQREEIETRLNENQVVQQPPAEQPAQPATASLVSPQPTQPQPTGEVSQKNPGFHYFGTPLGEMNEQVKQRLSAPGQGLIDFAQDGLNKLLSLAGVQTPKASKYEDEVAQATREISSVVLPTLILQGKGKQLGEEGHKILNWKLGNTGFMKFIGARGIEAWAAATVGAASTQYETDDNISGMLKKSFPKTFDFIPDSWATLAGDSPDLKRQKSINEDLALGFMIPMVGFAGKFVSAVSEVKDVFKRAPVTVG